MSDSLYQGRRIRTLDVLDEAVREALAIEVDISLAVTRIDGYARAGQSAYAFFAIACL